MRDQLVSIIIPCYNAERYISETLESALNQTWPHIEIVAVNDGSTDNTLQILQNYKQDNIIITNQSHKGASAARNHGLSLATGKYIQFLDADDLLSPHKIEKQVKILTQNPNKVAVCPTIHFFSKEEMNFKGNFDDNFLYNTDSPTDFLINLYGGNGKGGMITVHAWLTPINLIKEAGPWNEALSLDDDGEFFCRVVLKSAGIRFTSDVYSYYRKYINGTNLSAQKNFTAFSSTYESFKSKLGHLLKATQESKAKKALARLFMELAVASYPQYISISEKALKQVKLLGGSDYVPVMGSRFLESIKNVFGWKVARYISYNRQRLFTQTKS